ncbi:MAG: fructosamine kinase family protein [Pseudomonadota bacterium]|nr:fructosamine kinase family protein [Pseudomonadota bacterium]
MIDAHPASQALRRAVAKALSADAASGLEIRWKRAARSTFDSTWRLDAGPRSYFLKLGRATSYERYEAEAAGLRELATAAAVRVPTVIAVESAAGHAWLALEWLELRGTGRSAALGHRLAALHRITSACHGWSRDNTIGATPQANAWETDWATFFIERRLRPQIARAAHGGYRSVGEEGEPLLSHVPALLNGHAPAASLVHGDLWSGNAASLATGEPVIFDPAVYYGDRETDIAMTELFGGFEPSFYAAYADAWPLSPGYPVRRTLYNLYHLLNHLNLFGVSYEAQVRRAIGSLMAELR